VRDELAAALYPHDDDDDDDDDDSSYCDDAVKNLSDYKTLLARSQQLVARIYNHFSKSYLIWVSSVAPIFVYGLYKMFLFHIRPLISRY